MLAASKLKTALSKMDGIMQDSVRGAENIHCDMIEGRLNQSVRRRCLIISNALICTFGEVPC